MTTLAYVAAALGMLALGPALAAALRRRTGVGWGLFGLGAITFVGSQVVHLPLNAGVAWAIGAGVLPRPPEAWDPVLLPLALGLSAGLCEETARLVALWRSRAVRRAPAAAMVGVGHGGVEAAIVGLLLLLTVVQMVALRDPAAAARAGVDPTVVTQFFDVPPAMALLGLVERVFAVTVHVTCTLLVARAVLARSALPWVAAVLLHAGVDAAAVAAVTRFGPLVTEGVLALCALGCLGLAIALWRGWPAPPAGPAPPPPPPTPSGPRPLAAGDAADASIG
jgi:uncharacterized membrane protein YhfC